MFKLERFLPFNCKTPYRTYSRNIKQTIALGNIRDMLMNTSTPRINEKQFKIGWFVEKNRGILINHNEQFKNF